MTSGGQRQARSNGVPRSLSVGAPVALAVLAVTVQWGVVTTKLDHVERRLDELIVEARAIRSEYQSIERRVSFLEGRFTGGSGGSGGGRDAP